jgi:uncharacterized membrane protein YgdD (TMEM256/DUF423 family)
MWIEYTSLLKNVYFMKQATQMRIAGISGALAIMAGAFGAHLLEEAMEPRYLESFETAARYHLIHSVVMFIIASRSESIQTKVNWSFTLFLSGIVFFSGSLYGLTLLTINFGNQFSWLGAITPIGGLFMIAGWLSLASVVIAKK